MGDSILIGGPGGSIILAAILGYFVYNQTLAGAFGSVLLCIVLEASIFISVIPFAGVFVQAFVNINFLIPGVLGFTGLWDTWLVTLMFAVSTAFGILVTIVVSGMIVAAMTD